MGLNDVALFTGLYKTYTEEFVDLFFDFNHVVGIHAIASLLYRLSVVREVYLVLVVLGIQSLHVYVGPCEYILIVCKQPYEDRPFVGWYVVGDFQRARVFVETEVE